MGMIGMFVQLSNEQFSRALSNPEALDQLLENVAEENILDVDKSWEGIYFILTGSALAEDDSHPLGKIIFSNQYFDETQNMGYGPAHYLTPGQVKEMNAELQKISFEEVQKRFKGDTMDEKGVYPEGWKEQESFEYLNENFSALKHFYQSATDKNNAVVSYII